MNTQTQTPRTDALWAEWNSDSGLVECRNVIDFARTLERELGEARAALETIFAVDAERGSGADRATKMARIAGEALRAALATVQA